ncbi:MAG: CARDB domain-containing protein [Patescibacteria group bacterium]|nr:CARDB domain-containing protein [Patescibacteria group bacterium]
MKKINFCLIFCLVALIVLFGFKNPVKAEDSYDLKAESLIMNSAKCEVNQTCSFTARVKNLGSSFTMDFPLNSSLSAANSAGFQASYSPAQGAAIKTNDYITFTINLKVTKIGSVDMTFKVDPAGYLTESNANNNSTSLKVNVVGYDLAVESITTTPVKPTIKQNCLLRVKVKNNSSYNLYTSSGLDFIKDFTDFTITKASSTTPSLNHLINSGGYLYYEYEGNFSSNGDKRLSFTVDPKDDLKEVDLANNIANATTTVLTAAETDLAVNSISFSPAKLVVGQAVDITVGVKNTGKTSLTDGAGLAKSEISYNITNSSFNANDLVVDAEPNLNAPLKPDDIFHYVFHGSFTKAGQAAINFVVNKNKYLVELNEANSSTSTPVMVYNSLDEANDFTFANQKLVFASSTTAILSWSTNVLTTGKVNYGLKNESISTNKVEVTTNSSNFSVTLNGLNPGADYVYQITAKNSTLEKQDAAASFTSPPNNVLAITTGPSASVNNKTAIFSWTTNLTASSRIYYKKQGVNNLSDSGSGAFTVDHKIELKDLAVGLYDYFLSSTSTAKTNIKTAGAVFEIREAAASAPASSAAPAAANNSAAPASAASLTVNDDKLYGQLKGKILLKVESQGQAYYVSNKEKKVYYLGRPADAFQVIRGQGIGISNANLAKIPIGLSALSGADSDGDGLPDALETAIGTDKNKTDSDGDSFNDKAELAGGYAPWAKNIKIGYDNNFTASQKGKIFLQTEGRGEAWYVSPSDGKRYFLARPADAFNVMRNLGAGISNSNFSKLAGK